MEIKNKRYLPHEINTRYYACVTFLNNHDMNYTCRKYHISSRSLYRWLKRFDGTKESLLDRSSRPKTKHPKAHTEQEILWIKNYIRRNPSITLNELWYKLKRNKGYTRHPTSLYRVLKRLGFYHVTKINNTRIKHTGKYETPLNIGEKWQIDVKYVPKECKTNTLPFDLNFYQYTCIDEATRQRFLFWYNEATPVNTVDFVRKAINFYGYKPREIQTDNGQEFTFNSPVVKKVHLLDLFLGSEKIIHHKIRPRTPWHNGKVERSHRNDNERFYNFLKFYSLEDLRKQGQAYLRRSNNIPMSCLNYLTPLEKRKELEFQIV